MQGVAFNVLMSKVIPTNQRGKLMGTRNFLGGLIAAGVAWLSATYLVDRNMFGSGYGSTFMLAFILTSLGITALTFVREPQALSVRERSAGFLERLADIPHMLRNDPNYRRFFIARGLGALGSAAVPFYMLHIRKFIPPSEAAGMLGLFSLAFLLPPTFSNLVWGRIADAKGYRLVYLLSVGLWCGSTMLLIFGSSMPVFLLAACGLGTGQAGYMMASQSFVLEFGKPHEVPMLIAVSDTASHLMMIIGPVMGGLLARQAGYASVFWCSLVFLLIAVMTVWQIQEPRDRTPVPARMDND
jgi:MFS family permease